MDLINRYLHAVRFWLPPAQQDDIIAEIADDLGSQIGSQEADLGRPLGDADIADILKRRGRPMLVAAGYQSHRPLIGAGLMPAYNFILRMSTLWVLLPLYLLVIGPLDAAASNNIFASMVHTTWNYLVVSLFTIGGLTLLFAIFERSGERIICQWDPRSLPPVPAARGNKGESRFGSIAAISTNLFWFFGWLYVIQTRPDLELEHFRISLAPVWHSLAAPIAFLFAAGATIGAIALVQPNRISLRSASKLTLHAYSLILIWVLASAGTLFGVVPLTSTVQVSAAITQWIDIGLRITFLLMACTAVYDAAIEIRRLLRSPAVMAST
jgi:hypothetical protein